MIDLTNAGSEAVFDVSEIEVFSATTPLKALFGSAVITFYRRVGGVDSAFSPAETMTSSIDFVDAADVSGFDEVVAKVTTADSTSGDVPLTGFGE